MSDLESVKDRIFERYHTNEIKIDSEAYKKLSTQDKEKYVHISEFQYSKKLDIPLEEMSVFLALKSFEAQMETKEAVITIKNIIVFIFVMSIIASILLLIIQALSF